MQSMRTALTRSLLISTAATALMAGARHGPDHRRAPAAPRSARSSSPGRPCRPRWTRWRCRSNIVDQAQDPERRGRTPTPLEILRKVDAGLRRPRQHRRQQRQQHQPEHRRRLPGAAARPRHPGADQRPPRRRSAPSPGIGGKVFVDVNQIPPSAIERVEVLADGASAIYGSDAVGGVVNFILKTQVRRVSRSAAAYGGRRRGLHREIRLLHRRPFVLNDRVDVILSGAYTQTDPLYQTRPRLHQSLHRQRHQRPGRGRARTC